jgi:transposase
MLQVATSEATYLSQEVERLSQLNQELVALVDEFKGRDSEHRLLNEELVGKLALMNRILEEQANESDLRDRENAKRIESLEKQLGKPKKNRKNSHQSSDVINPPPKKKVKPEDNAGAGSSGAEGAEAGNPDAEGAEAGNPGAEGAEAENPGADEKVKRKIGAQPGHEAHQHKRFDTNDPSVEIIHFFPPQGTVCQCGSNMERLPESFGYSMDQYELPEIPIKKIVNVADGYVCPDCGRIHEPHLPDYLKKQGLIGERLAALIGTLNLTGRVPYRGIQELLGALHADISLGCVSKCLAKMANALDGPYRELYEKLKDEPVLNIDETSHKENGKRLYTWAFAARDFVVFVIGFRAASVLEAALTLDYKGIIGCDYYSAYRAYFKNNPNAQPAFCHAHLVRDLKYLADHLLEPEVVAFGEELLGIEKRLFELWHEFSLNPSEELHQKLRECAEEFRSAAWRAPDDNKTQAIAKRFVDWPEGYFTFIDNEGVDPTNNSVEGFFRFIALVRKISQGTRSEAGRSIRERVWTAFATCRKRKRSVFEYFLMAYSAWSRGEPAPSLLS